MTEDNKSSTFYKHLIQRGEEAKTVRKIVFFIFLAFLIIFISVGFYVYQYITSALEPVDPENKETIDIEIPFGSSTSTIANILEEEGIIKDARIFRFYVKFKNFSDFQAGEYSLSPSLSLNDVVESLESGKVINEATYVVTIPEGKTVKEIAEIFSEELPITKDEFLEVTEDEKYINDLIEQYPSLLNETILDPDIRTPLEGYLFAATYSFYEEEPSISSIIEQMLNKTVEIVQPYYDLIESHNLSIHEALTMASLVEKEARTEEERQKIAGIFYNRLAENMPLQTDPTILYALGEHKERVLYEDLEIDSPYNTYKYPNLPVGPISNFGENSLEATLNPEESDYMYFLHDYDGKIYYAKTYEEHLELKNKYRSDDDF